MVIIYNMIVVCLLKLWWSISMFWKSAREQQLNASVDLLLSMFHLPAVLYGMTTHNLLNCFI